MKMKKMMWIAASVCLTVVMTMSPGSNAAISAMAGNPVNPELTCFTNSNGIVKNECTQSRWYCVAPQVSGGWKTVKVVATRPNGNYDLKCQARSVDKEGVIQSDTGNIYLTPVDITTQFTVGNVYVPSYGAAYVCCYLPVDGRLHTVNFD